MHFMIYADLKITAEELDQIERLYQGKKQMPREMDIEEYFPPTLLSARRLVLGVKPHASWSAGVAR